MGKRRQREEEHENHDRWLVSYADFVTLLFAFFVVMYAISSVNQGKYRVLSESLSTAFLESPSTASGDIISINPIRPLSAAQSPVQLAKPAQFSDKARAQQREQLGNMARQLKDALGPLVKDGHAHVSDGAYGLTLDINSSMLFALGDAQLSPAAAGIMEKIAGILASSAFPVVVEGHTDNTPINTAQFPSNWELSSMRASSLVRVFVDNGISAARLSAVGYADQRPLADNATTDGRQRNRRVAITIALPEEDKPAGILTPR
jgi:chemotaxis protein MotB